MLLSRKKNIKPEKDLKKLGGVGMSPQERGAKEDSGGSY